MTRSRRRTRLALYAAVVVAMFGGAYACGSPAASVRRPAHLAGTPADPSGSASASPAAPSGLLPGMPPPLVADDLYAADRPGALSPTVVGDKALIYVPNHTGNTVSVIDQRTFRVIRTVKVPAGPEHVVPSYDLKTLWVNSDYGNALTPIDARTGAFGKPVAVNDPYNLYFTPDGRFAVVMAEAAHEIVFRDPHTMAIRKVLPVKCAGVNHADFSADGRYFIASCEFSGDLIKVDTVRQRVITQVRLPGRHPMPQDVKISPDGRTWYIADMQSNGVWILHNGDLAHPAFLATGGGAHGLYVSRDSKRLYITNRGEGSISVLEFATGRLVAKWWIPGGGTPDMGGLSADGRLLWVSGRYRGVVYAISTIDGKLVHKIAVGAEPHGLCVWPQPGRYSLGHTGILR